MPEMLCTFLSNVREGEEIYISIPNWTKLAKVRAISQVPPFVFFNVRKGSLYLPSHLSCDPDDKRVLAYFVRTNMP